MQNLREMKALKVISRGVAFLFIVQQCLLPIPPARAHDSVLYDPWNVETPVQEISDVDVTEPAAEEPLETFSPSQDQPLTFPTEEDEEELAAGSSTDSGYSDEEPAAARASGGPKTGGGWRTTDTTAPVISAVTATNITVSGAVISWTTNESSTSVVEYGASASYGTSTSSGTLVTYHSLTLTNLTANQTYHYRVVSKDKAGNTAYSIDFTFTTLVDSTAPVISAVASQDITQSGATITWATNEASDTRVEFGLDTNYGNTTALNSNKVTSHSVALSNLSPGRVYHYRVYSCDAAGNLSISADYTFTTNALPDSTGPVISGVTLATVTPTSAVVNWMTDEAATSQIEYGLTTSYGNFTLIDSSLVTRHEDTIQNLATNTLYHYRIISYDALGNKTVSGDFSFTTLTNNSAPFITVSVPASLTFYQGQAVSMTVNGMDLENDAMTFSVSGNPSGSTLTPDADGLRARFYWVPASSQSGDFVVTFSVSDGQFTVTRTVTVTVLANAILVNQIDNDFNVTGYQIYENSQYSKVTYTHLNMPTTTWSWHYRLNGGPEVLMTQGSGTATAAATIDFRGMAAGNYDIILKKSDGTVQSVFTTQVIAGSWAQNNTPTLALDFDGSYVQSWGSWSNITTPRYDQDSNSASFSLSEFASMVNIFRRVVEKFSMFGLFVTALDPFRFTTPFATKEDEFAARSSYATANKILYANIGGSSTWYGSTVGGVAYVNSFTNSLPNFVFVFENNLGNGNAKYTAEAIAHESGHAFGLHHHSTPTTGYSQGGNGMAPILGISYYATRGLWWDDSCAAGYSCQDDLAILSGTANGFGFKADDYGDTISSASGFRQKTQTSWSANGIIGNVADKDYFQFTLTQAGSVSFSVSNSAYGGMLDPVVELRDSAGNLISTVDATLVSGRFTAVLNAALQAGTYYLVVRGHGQVNAGGDLGFGYDLGQYSITATVPRGATTLPLFMSGSSSSVTSSGTSSGGGSISAAAGVGGGASKGPAWSLHGSTHYRTALQNQMMRRSFVRTSPAKKRK